MWAGLAVLLPAVVAAGCTANKQQPAKTVEPNQYPSNYRNQVASLLTVVLKDPTDFHGALIAQPVLKPVGDGQHYVVCVALNGHNQRKNKVAIYLEGVVTQFIDAKPEQCGDAAYQPFPELEQNAPR